MKKITTNIKKQFLISILVLLLVFTSFMGVLSYVGISKNEVFADVASYKQISIPNSDFTSNTQSGLSKPNSFTAVGSENSTVSGVIDVDVNKFNDYKEDYKLDFNPSKPKVCEDNKILMINNKNLKSSYGYESSTFNLEKNSYYFVSCLVYTQFETDGIASSASLYLSNETLDNLENSKMENISTRGNWKEYRFYIHTNDQSQTVKFVMFIGSKNSYSSAGAVFFDNINAYKLNEKQYYNEIGSTLTTNKVITLTNKDVSASNGILNGDFENSGLDFTISSSSSTSTVNNVAKVVGIGNNFDNTINNVVDPTSANRANNTKALLISHYNSAYTAFVSNDILIERHKLYKLSIDVKTSSFSNGGAEIKLEQKNPYSEGYKFTPASVSFSGVSTSDKTNEATNDWITYSFFITGNAFKDSYATLTLGLEEKAIGYVFFDNIKLFEITSKDFSNNSSSSNCKTADFTGFSGTDSITNSSFNNIDFETTNETSPFKAKDWTVTKDDNSNNYNGIINEYLDYQNVFVMANQDAGYQSLKSSNFALTASTLETKKYYKISFEINTNAILFNGVDVVVKNSDGNSIGKLFNINTNNAWQTVSFYVLTSTSDLEANITVSLGNNQKQEKGYCYIDNFSIADSTEEVFNNITNSNLTQKCDLTKIDFSLRSENSTNKIFSADNFTGTKNSSLTAEIEAGIVNINTYPADVSGDNDYVLVIHNKQDAYYTLKSNGYKLSNENYYKITASVRTYNLKQDDANKQYDDKGNLYKIGAKVSLSGINAEIAEIQENDNFSTYTFFVSATNDTTIYFNLSLGNENALTSGYAFFDNLTVNQISEDAFNEAKKNKTENDTKTLIIGDTNTTNNDNNNNQDNSSALNFDWLVVPSLIIGIALLIAMIGLLIRKINFKMPVKAKVKDYDRAKTVVKEYEKRERIKQREEKLNELRKRLEELENEIQQNKNEYKNSKSLKQEIKEEHEKVDAKIKQSYSDVNTLEAKNEAKRFKLEAKNRVKQLRKEKYQANREELMQKYLEIEKEIDAILEEERLLVEEWKAYKKQLKQEKKEKREKKLKNKKK